MGQGPRYKLYILYCLKIDHGGRDWDRNFLYCIALKWTMGQGQRYKLYILYCLKIDHGGRDWDRNFLYCIVLKWTMRQGRGYQLFILYFLKMNHQVGSKELGCKHFILYCLKMDHGVGTGIPTFYILLPCFNVVLIQWLTCFKTLSVGKFN